MTTTILLMLGCTAVGAIIGGAWVAHRTRGARTWGQTLRQVSRLAGGPGPWRPEP